MRKTLALALLCLCACGPAVDYAGSPKVPVEVLGFEEINRKQVAGGRTWTETVYRFFLKNSSGGNCKMMGVEYEGLHWKDHTCTPPGNYAPLDNAVVYAYITSGFTFHKYTGYCVTEIIYKK
ncbi:MAG: hypothetical protein NZ560_05560 [Aquificaceae bacterium]|nr:hypothetical protein [Aquificaceae bacterium]MDW8096923.1 hypothetical protein [Aquificaceae bacterium]